MKDFFSANSNESMKRLIAFICVVALLLIAFLTFNFGLNKNQTEIILSIVSVLQIIIIFALGFTSIEKFKK